MATRPHDDDEPEAELPPELVPKPTQPVVKINLSDFGCGPNFHCKELFKLGIFAFVVATKFFQQCFQVGDDDANIVFVSPLCIYFCKYCGKCFRFPETLHTHFNKESEDCNGCPHKKTQGTRSIKVRHPEVAKEYLKRGERAPDQTMKLKNLTEEDKQRICDKVSSVQLTYPLIDKVLPPLHLRFNNRFHYPKHPTNAGQCAEFRLKKTNLKPPIPNALWDSEPVQSAAGKGLAPFLLVTDSLVIENISKWIADNVPEQFRKRICLVACDETTCFGCIGCGKITPAGSTLKKCMIECFGMPTKTEEDPEKAVKQEVRYRGSFKFHDDTTNLNCSFAETVTLAQLKDNMAFTGKEMASFVPNKKGPKFKKPRVEPDVESGDDEEVEKNPPVYRNYIDFE